jgi:hypothetical protein
MARLDWEEERRRLSVRYEGMEDGELIKIAGDFDSLSGVAADVLRTEMSKRNLQIPVQRADVERRNKEQSELPEPALVRRYRDLPEATVAKSILESAGIESFLADDNLVRMDWLYSNLVGGIKLLVRHEDAEAAYELLRQGVPENFEVEGLGNYEQPKCPQCDSMDITFGELDKPMAVAGFMVGLPIAMAKTDWHCHTCKHRWKDGDAGRTENSNRPEEA